MASLLLLVPCFWQARIQAGDLSSHIYNSWLAELIHTGRAPGLAIVPQTTNVLFDVLLSGLFSAAGAAAAQRIAVAIAVLVFSWGAFAFASAVAGRPAWSVLPLIGMLAHGWVFHMGFFNFYLGMGLCCWALALAWKTTPPRLAAAAALAALAYTAHALPVVWAGGLFAYVLVARRLGAKGRARLTTAAVAAMALAHLASRAWMRSLWSPGQLAQSTGVDQLWLYDDKYYAAMTALLLVEAMMLRRLVRARGVLEVVAGIPFHLAVLAAAAVFVLPNAVFIPGYAHGLMFIATRLSLGVGICVCVLLAKVGTVKWERVAMAAAIAIFFGMAYRDEAVLNTFEERIERVIAPVPKDARVINLIFGDNGTRGIPMTHMIDRVCIRRCFSYGNYEPSTTQFRIRAQARNPIVVDNYVDSFRLQTGGYVVKDGDVPLYAVDISPDGALRLLSLPIGYKTSMTMWEALENRPFR